MNNEMTNEEYLQAQHTLTMMAEILKGVDLTAFINRINRAEAIGPILDPTLYRDSMERVSALKETAQAARGFQKASEDWLAQITLTTAGSPATGGIGEIDPHASPVPFVPPKRKRTELPSSPEISLASAGAGLTPEQLGKLVTCGAKTDLDGNLRCGKCGDVVRSKKEGPKVALCDTCDHVCGVVVGVDPW